MLDYYIIDSFTDTLFKGNPAGVCVLESPLPDDILQQISFENNLSETAFIYPLSNNIYNLRWFTPKVEVDLCGHATLAAAFVVANFLSQNIKKIVFSTCSGDIFVNICSNLYELFFPKRLPTLVDKISFAEKAIGFPVLNTYQSRDFIILLSSEEEVLLAKPDFNFMLEHSEYFSFVITAKGKSCDFVSRFFAPNCGVYEDPVTGSSHSSLIPLWANILSKKKLFARQLSARGGSLYCEDLGKLVKIAGHAVLYLQGKINY